MINNPYHTDSHRMGRRSHHKDYRWAGIYHITMTVNDRRQQPLGHIVGDASKADGDPNAPRVVLSEIGEMVEHELLHSITARYPMVEVQDYVIMPDHVHCIMVVKSTIISKNGKETHLGQLISGFKKGCSRHYWEMTGQAAVLQWGNPTDAGKQPGNPTNAGKQPEAATAVIGTDGLRSAGFPQSYVKIPSRTTTGRQPLFSNRYVDVIPLEEGQLETQRAYIRNNPRNRLLRSQNRSSLQVQRGGIDTALSLSALRGYLQCECGSAFSDETWMMVSRRLLMNGTHVECDSYGDRQLLIVTPWVYKYRPAEEDITVIECKTMNCVAQALCRQRDDWWKKT